MRVGINTGLAVLDMVGDQIRTEYTAMGDATNVAARMQSAATPGTVLISGLPAGSTNKTDFNGSFSVGQVLDATHFQYFQADKDDTSTCTTGCVASSGTPFLTYSISPSIVGIAINPITRSAVLAGYGVTFISRAAIDADVAAGVLALARVEGLDPAREISLARASGRAETRVAQEFVRFARERLNSSDIA